jgi:hypothetical protein
MSEIYKKYTDNVKCVDANVSPVFRPRAGEAIIEIVEAVRVGAAASRLRTSGDCGVMRHTARSLIAGRPDRSSRDLSREEL